MCTTMMVLTTIALILRQKFSNKIRPYSHSYELLQTLYQGCPILVLETFDMVGLKSGVSNSFSSGGPQNNSMIANK
uniref:Uncharacterized protein n=1 Tax=Sphaeramia orbicularis TaxID=375764 RepID=A0A672Y4S1_9TELE